VRLWLLVVAAACGKASPRVLPHDPPASPAPPPPAVDGSVAAEAYEDLGAALRAVIPDGARVIGFGELHARTDRAQVPSALARFTRDGLPAIADRLSDLVVETWVVDGACGSAAAHATAKVEATMRRPIETKSEITVLAEAAFSAMIQPHAMRITCADYDRIVPHGGEMAPEAMLALTTRELGRIVTEAVAHRDHEPGHRPWIAVYGGALHNDRFPEPSVAEWSYAARADAATGDRFVEIDLIVPELAEADETSRRAPWFPLVASTDGKLHAFKRGERS
jgi:hypothetical protein